MRFLGLWIFLPRNRIICQVENSLYLDRGSAMNASSTELHRKIRRTAGRALGMRSGGVQNAAEKGRMNEKNLEAIKDVWKPCNPFKSHKTAKDFFGKAWSETRDFWRSLEKGLEGAFIPPPLAPSHQRPPIKRDRHCEERSFAALLVRPRKAA